MWIGAVILAVFATILSVLIGVSVGRLWGVTGVTLVLSALVGTGVFLWGVDRVSWEARPCVCRR
jgi:hypothetical protein